MLDKLKGAAREPLGNIVPAEVQRLVQTGVLIADDRRHRPHYFDGRFLTARDLTREQNYFLTRLSDLGRSQGFGVVEGLDAGIGAGSTVVIDAGYGYTPAGELVMLSERLELQVDDLARSQQLDAAFGLRRLPNAPARNLTGLFVIALRPVEFTSNPIASYPTSIDGPRSTEDGDIVEATVVSLVPYQPRVPALEPARLRAQAAREIFLDGISHALPQNALPLAMVALERGIPRWIDAYMVRRDAGSEREDILGLGFAPRALREAHVRHYDDHLRDVLAERDAGGRGRRFEAAEHFATLPAAGRLPAAAVNTSDFTQIFFPPEIDVELSVVPEDEVPLLLEESLLLPPIDLSLGGAEQESTSVLLLVPVPRPRLRTLMTRLEGQTRSVTTATPGLVAKRLPIESLRRLTLPRVAPQAGVPETVSDAAWREALGSVEFLWYTRRRNLAYRAEITGVSVPIVGDDAVVEDALTDRLRDAELVTRFNTLRNATTSAARADVVGTLSTIGALDSRVVLEGALVELEAEHEDDDARLTIGRIQPIIERFTAAGTGLGIARLEEAQPELKATGIARTIAQSKRVPELDTLARSMSEENAKVFAAKLQDAARENPERVAALIDEASRELPR